jgi:hypothetical protein
MRNNMRKPVINRSLRQFFLVGLLACCSVVGRGSPTGTAAANLRIAQDTSTVSVLDGERPILRYRYADIPMKPYIDQLFSPAGVQVLRDSPRDHKHHHALMFALAVEGVNFWEERVAQSGKQGHTSLIGVTASDNGNGRAGFIQELEWVAPASDRPLLLERRLIDVLRASDLNATLVDWRCRLQTPPGKDSMTLSGEHYFGLGMRFVASMDEGGRFFNADDKPGEIVRGDERLTPTKWCAFTAKADGKPVTVAIFDHPQNPRYPARMFTMAKPFAYLSATRNEWKEPLVVKADKPLELCYGVALWDGEVDRAVVEKLYQRWLQLTAGRGEK